MPDGDVGSPGPAPEGGGQPTGSTGVDWSKGGAEHFGAFKESLGDLGKDKSLEPIKDFAGMAKGYVSAQKMIGGGIYLPKENATPEEKAKASKEIRDKLRKAGIIESAPESPDKYEIKMPETYGGEPFKPNEPLINAFKEFAHKEDIPQSKVQKVFDWYLNLQEEVRSSNDKQFEDLKRGLFKEWGGLAPRNMEAARRAAFKYLGEDSEKILTDSRVPPDISMKILRAFAEIGDPLLEDGIVTGSIKGMPSKDEVWKKMVDMQSQPAADVSHIGHKIWVDEYNKLNAMHAQMK